MKLTRNLSGPMRLAYAVFGVGLFAAALATMEGWSSWLVAALGVFAFIEGTVGW